MQDDEIIEHLSDRFVPVAVDQHIHRRLGGEEGTLFARVLQQAGRGLGGRSQGVYIFSPEGTLLAFANTADAAAAKRLIATALEKFDGESVSEIARPAEIAEPPLPVLPEGGVVVDVAAKVLGGYEPSDPRAARYANSLGRDHLWLRADEVKALARGELPASVQQRIARYHLIDNTRGEPPFWSGDEIKTIALSLDQGRITGAIHLETRSGSRGYRAEVLGIVEASGERLTRFDVVVQGEFWGEGTYTRGAPRGKFPLAIALSLADPDDPIAKVPPQAARGGAAGYLRY